MERVSPNGLGSRDKNPTRANQEPMRRCIVNRDELEDTTIYKVVVNDEEQYSIWPAHRANPPGWHDGGKSGPQAECLAFIEEVWTDMRPLSLRKHMAGTAS
jgi:MbtH protein